MKSASEKIKSLFIPEEGGGADMQMVIDQLKLDSEREIKNNPVRSPQGPDEDEEEEEEESVLI
ncbi:Hypothetical predicted protein [Xyrichtys novacula]|uniref:Uncharacterized protein n=1 Tax=Xyrichtys novacula TaxID=13765 RepID=A0AAV1GYE3_XYRNO|nr:Hypothetical predicted protein [Xyrichtys novacula]